MSNTPRGVPTFLLDMLVSVLLFTLARVAPLASYQHHIWGFSTAAVPSSRLKTAVMTVSRKRVRAAAGVACDAGAASPHDAIGDIEELPAGLVDGYRQHQGLLYHDFSPDEVGLWQTTCIPPMCTLIADCSTARWPRWKMKFEFQTFKQP